MEFVHKSVLLDEVIEGLDIKENGTYVDGTLGGAGHAGHVCERLGTDGRFIGIDQDEDAIKVSTERLKKYGDKVTIVRSNYSDMPDVVHELGISGVDGITLDLGVSSFHLNEYTESELFHIIKNYGEDKFAKNIAKHIVMERQESPILTTKRLAEIVDHAIPMKMKKQGGHPAKRTFQAIRIEVNHELDVLEKNLNDMIDLLNPGGRFCIITFHSLEDRIVKNAFRTAQNPCVCPSDFPVCVCGRKPKGRVITRKPILPSGEEMEVNPRSKSAKLRIFEHN